LDVATHSPFTPSFGRYECNYGGGGLPLDKVFGTFREKLGTSKMYSGAAEKLTSSAAAVTAEEEKACRHQGGTTATAARVVGKPNGLSTLTVVGALPKFDDGVYFVLMALIAATLWVTVTRPEFGLGSLTLGGLNAMALLVSFGPVAAGLLLRQIFGDKMPLTWPFHKEPLVGPLGLHLALGTLFAIVPVYAAVAMLVGSSTAVLP